MMPEPNHVVGQGTSKFLLYESLPSRSLFTCPALGNLAPQFLQPRPDLVRFGAVIVGIERDDQGGGLAALGDHVMGALSFAHTTPEARLQFTDANFFCSGRGLLLSNHPCKGSEPSQG